MVQSPQLGVNATADTTNRLSVPSPATLLNHEGAGHQLKINKAGITHTASLLYQTGFSRRAEMGLAGLVAGTAIQQDYHDTTEGRLLRAGAYGWGHDGAAQTNVLLNAALSSGVHQFSPADPDKPISTGGSVLVVRYTSQ